MNKIIIVTRSYQRARYYLTQELRTPVNPRGRNVYILTGDQDVYKIRGLSLNPGDKIIYESEPVLPSPELFHYLRMLKWVS